MQKTLTKKWFGQKSAKWQFLKKLSDGLDIPNKGLSNYEKALLEWRFSLQFSEEFFSKLDASKFYSLSYQSFLENPKKIKEQLVKVQNTLNTLKTNGSSSELASLSLNKFL